MTVYLVEVEKHHFFSTPIKDQAVEGAKQIAKQTGEEVRVTRVTDYNARCVGYMPDGTINKYWEVQS